MKQLDINLFVILLFSFFPFFLRAQPVLAEKPHSADDDIRTRVERTRLEEFKIPQLDMARLEREDAQFPGERFAAPTRLDIRPSTHGTWINLPNGDRIWRLQLTARGANGLGVFYDDFFLPPGARLHLYTPDQSQVLGAYTAQNNPVSGRFLTGFLPGASAVIEYFEPAAVKGEGRFRIFRVDQVYRKGFLGHSPLRSNNELGFGAALGCHNNINCPEGEDYQTEKQGIVRILIVVEEGSGFCTGNLLNNTREDRNPLVLSAFHCQDGFTPEFDLWRFDFTYEGATCSNPESEPGRHSILGCQRLAGRQENDFILLKLNHLIPASFDPYFLGWNRSTLLPDKGAIIHHPRGDVKKISMDNDPIEVFPGRINWNNEVQTPPSHHFISYFDSGTFEIGSSGSALLDENRRVVGQLHGGISSCDTTLAYFGRLALAWEGGGTPETRLKDWLDPDNTGALQWNGQAVGPPVGIQLEGNVHTDGGQPVVGAQVAIIKLDGTALSTTTDLQGRYRFSDLTAGETYQVAISKIDDLLNGVSTLDLIQIQRHILNLVPLTSPYQLLSADVNGSGSVTTLDLIQIRRAILGLQEDFEAWPDWFFVPAANGLNDPNNPFAGFNESSYQLNEIMEDALDLDFIGFKPGDVNGSASQ